MTSSSVQALPSLDPLALVIEQLREQDQLRRQEQQRPEDVAPAVSSPARVRIPPSRLPQASAEPRLVVIVDREAVLEALAVVEIAIDQLVAHGSRLDHETDVGKNKTAMRRLTEVIARQQDPHLKKALQAVARSGGVVIASAWLTGLNRDAERAQKAQAATAAVAAARALLT